MNQSLKAQIYITFKITLDKLGVKSIQVFVPSIMNNIRREVNILFNDTLNTFLFTHIKYQNDELYYYN